MAKKMLMLGMSVVATAGLGYAAGNANLGTMTAPDELEWQELRPGSPAESAAIALAPISAEHSTESVNTPALFLIVLSLMVLVLMFFHGNQGQSIYFFAAFIASGVYQIGDDQARSWIVVGMPSGIGRPLFTESKVVQRGVGISKTRT